MVVSEGGGSSVLVGWNGVVGVWGVCGVVVVGVSVSGSVILGVLGGEDWVNK